MALYKFVLWFVFQCYTACHYFSLLFMVEIFLFVCFFVEWGEEEVIVREKKAEGSIINQGRECTQRVISTSACNDV